MLPGRHPNRFGDRIGRDRAEPVEMRLNRAGGQRDREVAVEPRVRRAQRPGLMMAAIYRALLDRIEREDFQVLERRIRLTPLHKAWLAWRTSWTY